MPADNELDPLDRWLNQQVQPLPPPAGTFELITKRARRRRIRKAVISVASAAAVAAAVGVAVPVGMSLRVSPSPTNASLANGAVPTTGTASHTTLGSAGKQAGAAAPIRPASTATASSSAVPMSPGPAVGGYLPPDFQPYSVTWDSPSTGWVIGPAGTPGHCANSDPSVCTSVARTGDGGQTWHGLPAPDTGSPDGPSGVSGIRFLDGTNGWAFGPELWATHDGGRTWTKIPTDGQRVTDLETAGNRAYALFARCGGANVSSFANGCTSYTLMTATMDSDQWTPVGAATSGLTDPAAPAAGTAGVIALYGTTGYLVAPDGTLYSGSLGATWQKAGTMPCKPGAPQANGLPGQALIALTSTTRLATFCDGDPAAAAPTVYTSADSGATWTPTAGDWTGVVNQGQPTSIAATSSGTLVLATDQGIYLLPEAAAHWQAASAADSQMPPRGFSYLGMTTSKQGVALPADTSRHEIWMTTDGGETWQARPITS
jgi:photosystem II stability/assembly factor-like uncharacterized protein